jgi:hypothetical protein
MRLWQRIVVAILGVALAVLSGVAYVQRQRLAGQWMAYRVGRAAEFEQAAKLLAWFETGEDCQQRLRDLVTRWGTGNPRFDYYLARYVASPDSSEALRRRFCLELAWREGLLPRWAYFWSWRAGEQVDRRVEEIVGYVELLLASGDQARQITWREVLDLQAIFFLSGQPKWAERLTPDNWRDRYAQWRASRPDGPIRTRSVSKPFPDWQGPLP